MHDKTCHVALTYNDEMLPKDRYLDKAVHQKFMKKLRRRIDRKIRYYICGEYGFSGERVWNPHYHAILFNVDAKKDYLAIADSWTNEGKLNADIEQIQPVELTPELAAYCAGYVAKKAKDENNRWMDRDYAFVYKNFPKKNLPYATWSNGLGKETFEQMVEAVEKYGEKVRYMKTGGKKYPLGRYLTGLQPKQYKQRILDLWLGQQAMYSQRGKTIQRAKHSLERRSI